MDPVVAGFWHKRKPEVRLSDLCSILTLEYSNNGLFLEIISNKSIVDFEMLETKPTAVKKPSLKLHTSPR